MMNASDKYTRTAMVLHWLVAVLIVINVALAWTAGLFPDAMVRPVIDLHKSIGLTVLGLALLRILWRLSHRPPALPASYPRLERTAATGAHLVLYGLIVALPLSGWLHDSAYKYAADAPLRLFGVIPWFRIGLLMNLDPVTKEHWHSLLYLVHESLAYVLYVLVALHILGALKHQFLDRHAELQRMLP
jgi:cytochrome b561